MSELEPVACIVKHIGSRSAGAVFFAEPDFGNGEVWDREDYDVTSLVTLSSAQSALDAANARIAELKTWTDDDQARAWRQSFDNMHRRAMEAEARATKAEELLKEAVKVLEPLATEATHYDPDDGDGRSIAWDSDFTIGHLRAARALVEKMKGERG